MMIADPFRPRPVPKLTWAAAVPFPRSTWIHPYVPEDDFDRVSYTIWKNAQRQGTGVLRTRTTKEVEVDRDQRSLATPCSERCTVGAEDQEGRVKREAEEMLSMVRQELEDLYSDKSKESQGWEDELSRIEIPGARVEMKRSSAGILLKGVKQICVDGSSQPTSAESLIPLRPFTRGRSLHPAALPEASTPGRSRPAHPADTGRAPRRADQQDTPARTSRACQTEGVYYSSDSGDDSHGLPGPRRLTADRSSNEEAAAPTFGSGQCPCGASGPRQKPATCYSSFCDLDLPCRPLQPEACDAALPEPSPVAAQTDVSLALPTPTPNIKPFQPFEVSSGRKWDPQALERECDRRLLATDQMASVFPAGAPAVVPPVSMSALALAMIPDDQVVPFPLNPLAQFHVPAAFSTAAPAPAFFPPVWCRVKAPIQGRAPTPRARLSSKVPAPRQQGAYDLLADFPVLRPHNVKRGVGPAAQVWGADGRRRGLAAVPQDNLNQQPGGDGDREQGKEHSQPLVPRPVCEGGQGFTLALAPPPLAKPGLSNLPVANCGGAVHTQPITETDASVGVDMTSTRVDLASHAAATPEKAGGSDTQRTTDAGGNVKGESPAAKKNAACQATPPSMVANPSRAPCPHAVLQPMRLDFTPPTQSQVKKRQL
ncbi:uncharacterized protein LOC115535979 isoform X1 [Gadus morhua]|uniref:uncharacterized protein LOC115535979 isoform X1 n=1 Tax=Gadus morhua TaxID=8049 RepID=UPI0011B57A1F|nr:uncharacterized protein LOC115535979 isoform X1 [Gadus morhua]